MYGLIPDYLQPYVSGLDPSQWRWNPDTMSMESTQYGGGSYYFGDIPDPNQGSQIVSDLSAYNRSGGAEGTIQLAPGDNPYFGFGDSAQGYNAGLMPGSGIFASANPDEIAAYRDHARTQALQGVAKVGTLVGGAALGGALSGGSGAAQTGSATISATDSALGAVPGMAPGAGVLAPSTAGAYGVAAGTPAGIASAIGSAAPATASLAGGLGGLGLGGWLTLGSLGAQALQGNPDITQTSSRDAPAYLQPYLTQAAQAAQQRYAGGNYVAPVQQAASDYGTAVLNGSYLNANPYLDAAFNRAAGAVTNQVQSNFAQSGRNPRGIDAAGFAQQGYNDLANQIYGGNYQAERDRMQQIVPQAGALGSYTDPGRSLDDYIARLTNLGGGYGTTSSRIPTENNWLSGLAGLGLALIPGG